MFIDIFFFRWFIFVLSLSPNYTGIVSIEIYQSLDGGGTKTMAQTRFRPTLPHPICISAGPTLSAIVVPSLIAQALIFTEIIKKMFFLTWKNPMI